MVITTHASLILTGAGFAAGFVDSIAGGGGIISLPALLAAGIPPHLALGTNKLQSALGTSLAGANYARSGLLVRSQIALGMACTAIGGIGGAIVVTHASPDGLRLGIPFLLVAVFLYALVSPRFTSDRGGIMRPRMTQVAFSAVCGLILGFYDGFFGPGVGSFWTLAFVVLLGFSLPQATANTKAMNLTSNVVALSWFGGHGHVAWGLGLAMGAANMTGAAIGSSIALRRGARFIRVVFLIAVAATLAHLVWQSVIGGYG
ncbi:MAG: TSUP family transporter [Polyangiaceae bacterium]